MADRVNNEGRDLAGFAVDGDTSISDVITILHDIQAKCDPMRPDTFVMPMWSARLVERVRISCGMMPWSKDGRRYWNRRRRMARKKRRGWA